MPEHARTSIGGGETVEVLQRVDALLAEARGELMPLIRDGSPVAQAMASAMSAAIAAVPNEGRRAGIERLRRASGMGSGSGAREVGHV